MDGWNLKLKLATLKVIKGQLKAKKKKNTMQIIKNNYNEKVTT